MTSNPFLISSFKQSSREKKEEPYRRILHILAFLLFFSSIVFGTIVFYLCLNPNLNYILYISIVALLGCCCLMRLIEHITALFKQDEYVAHEAEAFTVIIPAYLPSEQNLILETVKYFLAIDWPLEIILAYNTPKELAVEQELEKLPITLIKVPNSQSKAENINYILPRIKTQYTAIFDADHNPLADSFAKALYRLKDGYDIVQGTCLPLANFPLGKFINIEFNQMYNVNHAARPRLCNFAIFGGSNGYFKTEVLQKLTFNHMMLTEDIDLSLRALLNNYIFFLTEI